MKKNLYDRLIQYILKNQERFYRLAYSYTKHQEDALDAVQNAVCKALEAHSDIKNEDAIKTWFYRILINECLSVIKKRSKAPLLSEPMEPEAVYYEKRYEAGGDIEIEKALSNLDMDVQSIIKLRFFEEMSLKEIACITGLNINTVKTKLYRGLKLLKEDLQEVDL